MSEQLRSTDTSSSPITPDSVYRLLQIRAANKYYLDEHLKENRRYTNMQFLGTNDSFYEISSSDIARFYLFSEFSQHRDYTYPPGIDEYDPNASLEAETLATGKKISFAMIHEQLREAHQIPLETPWRHDLAVALLGEAQYKRLVARVRTIGISQEMLETYLKERPGFSDRNIAMIYGERVTLHSLTEQIATGGIDRLLQQAEGNESMLKSLDWIVLYTPILQLNKTIREAMEKKDVSIVLDNTKDPTLLRDALNIMEVFQSAPQWRMIALHTNVFLHGSHTTNSRDSYQTIEEKKAKFLRLHDLMQHKKPWMAKYYTIDLMLHDAHTSGTVINDVIPIEDKSTLQAVLTAHDLGHKLGNMILAAVLTENDRIFLNQHFRMENGAPFPAQPSAVTDEEIDNFAKGILSLENLQIVDVLTALAHYDDIIKPLVARILSRDFQEVHANDSRERHTIALLMRFFYTALRN